jgi:hypothetical protein
MSDHGSECSVADAEGAIDEQPAGFVRLASGMLRGRRIISEC